MRITKVRSKDGETIITWEQETASKRTEKHSIESLDEPLPAFKEALAKLAEHVVDICELNKEDVPRVSVSGISLSWTQISKEEYAMGVTIIAAKTLLKSNCPLNIVTPHKFDIFPSGKDMGDEKQILSDKCLVAVRNVLERAKEYVRGDRLQTNLFADMDKEIAKKLAVKGNAK